MTSSFPALYSNNYRQYTLFRNKNLYSTKCSRETLHNACRYISALLKKTLIFL